MKQRGLAAGLGVVLVATLNLGCAHRAIVFQGHVFYEFDGRYYAMTEGLGVSSVESVAKAVALGGHLAVTTSQAEQVLSMSPFFRTTALLLCGSDCLITLKRASSFRQSVKR